MSYTEIAAALGITKGRVTQIRSTAPGPERAFFGVGPVAIGVPWRYQTTDRERPLIAAEDAQTGERLERLVESLSLAVTRFQIEPDREALPDGDAIVVCGPKSAPVAANLMERDPVLSMIKDSGRWWIQHEQSGERYSSPADDAPAKSTDIAYVARHRVGGRTVVHIAGIHGIGSLGAAHYLTGHLAELFSDTREQECSLIVRSTYDGLTITGSELAAGPFRW
ncbi:hypothetical protein ACIA5G_32550 [Amycolatopsis sp. NPDC051758]|uniref:hypothetical protein n=1 Tax=Amycolatopsis sp. NPDC051758 TaxID=3363935 RepID=UPI00378BFB17